MFRFCTVRRITFGNGSINELSKEITDLNGRNVIIVTDKRLSRSLIPNLTVSLESAGVKYEVWDEVVPEPDLETVKLAVEAVRRRGFDTVVGIGGGSSLDTAKLAANLASADKPLESYVDAPLPERKLKLILCPTTAGTGSEVTKLAVFGVPEKNIKYVFDSDSLYADVAIVDPDLTLTTPPSVTADTGVDALCHAIESYTSIYSSPITDVIAEEAIKIINRALREAYSNGSNVKARTEMSYAALLSGIAFNNAGTSLAHALGYAHAHIHKSPHGKSVGVTMPYVLQYNAISNIEKHARIARLLGENIDGMNPRDAALMAGIAFMKIIKDLNYPLKLIDLGVDEEKIPEVAERIFFSKKHVSRNPRAVRKDEMIELVRRAIYGDLIVPEP
jgi:alcohol dehydrogenase